jgi:integrase/recombinase XerD
VSSPIVTIFVRHSTGCKYAGDESAKRCDCRKHLRWFANGQQQRQSAGTRSWAEAEQVKRNLEDQLAGHTVAPAVEAAKPKTIGEAVDLFLKDKAVQGFGKANGLAYRHQLGRLVRYFGGLRVFTLAGVTRESLTGYCATWPTLYPSASTRYRVRARHNSFFKFCNDCGWLTRVPTLPRMAEPESETQPLTPEEFLRLLNSVFVLRDADDRARVRGLFLLQRWTGLAIRDALTLPKSELVLEAGGMYRVTTVRQKTGTHVSVPVPTAVALELLAIPNGNPDYFLYDGTRDEYLATVCMTKTVRAVFLAAKLDDGHMKSQRLRDTFAVELLSKGVPMEEVSKLLGHTSIRTTEKHYAKWAKGRQDRLDSLVMGTWAAPDKGRKAIRRAR